MTPTLGRKNPLLTAIRIVYLLICAWVIAAFVSPWTTIPPLVERHLIVAYCLVLVVTQLVLVLDVLIVKKRIEIISSIYFGLVVGVLLVYVLTRALDPVLRPILDEYYVRLIEMILFLSIPYACTSFLLQTKDDFRFLIPYVEFSRELKGNRPLVIDSSALIDGRIADLVETRIIDSQLIVPQFVLREVQEVADSADKMRRTRGRRGLEVLSKLQSSPHADVRVRENAGDDPQGLSVDQRLVDVAKRMGGRVVTNDFNLSKVAGVQGVEVINLNDIANALKPRYLPGERLRLRILKEGEAAGQGIGYLDDGTMVVCEQANHLIGQDIDIIVTSMLQSSAGRMIFGRQVHHTSK
ncbi:MAG TPA: PIN domain-containing protein [Planctomycetaceae bacterium]|nr:PIN domain-containing protein [Planctomycetaceae bacterium]